MHVRWIAASVIVAFSGSALAQSKAVLGKDDIAFANALRRFGYSDLAERLVGAIDKAGALGPEELITAKALRLNLRLDIAQREPDPAKRIDLLNAIREEMESMVDQYRGRQVAEDARNSLPDVYRLVGDAITAAISKTTDPAKIAEFQKIGTEIYSKAEDSFRARIQQLNETGNLDNPDIQNQLLAARYNLPRTQYFHALLYNKEEFRRKDLLNQAIKGFQEFSLDFSNTLQNYEGMILEGLCHKELGELDVAASAFKDAFHLPESAGWEKNTRGYYDMPKEVADTISEACLQWMNLLIEQKDGAGAIAVAKEFKDSIPGALETRRGLQILAAMGDAYLAADDVKSANDIADQLVKADPGGYYAAKGREIQGRTMGSGKVDPTRALAIAKTDADRGDDTAALQHATMALRALKGKPEEAKLSPDVYLFLGGLFAKRNLDEEAALAFDTGADQFPNSDQAPELIYQAIQRYIEINKDKRPYYKKRIDERMKLLAAKYPNSDRAQGSVMLEADQAYAEGRYLEAADQYVKVLPSSRVYLEAQAKAGQSYLQHAFVTLKDKPAEQKTYYAQAETILKKVQADADKRLKEIVDPAEQVRLQGNALRAVMRLCELYLNTEHPEQVKPLLDGVEDRYGATGDPLSYIWSFRIRALEKQDKVDEAVTLLEGLIKKDPQSKAIPIAAGIVARALDKKGQAERKAGKNAEGAASLKRAAQYYSTAGRALLASGEGKPSDVEDIANRLFVLALDANEVPNDTSTFIGWDPKKTKDTELYQIAADLFETALKRSPNSKSAATLGKIYGFLGKWDKADARFADLITSEGLLDAAAKKLNMRVATQKSDLVTSLFEWGVAENKLAIAQSDNDRFRHAQIIFDTLKGKGVYQAGSWWWWHAQFFAIRNLTDIGNYTAAKFELNQLERQNNDLGEKVGLAGDFAALKKELDNK